MGKKKIAEILSVNLFELFEISDDYVGEDGLALNLAVPEDLSSYLCREERFTNLQREHYKREISKFQLSELEEKIFSFVPAQNDGFRDIVSRISRSLTRPLLKNMKEDTDEYAKAIRSLSTEGLTLSIEWVDWNIPELMTAKNHAKDFSAVALGIRIEEPGYEPFTVYGLKDYSHVGVQKNARFKRKGLLVGDLADLLSCIILHQQVNKFVKRLQAEGAENPLYEPFCRACFDYTVDLYKQLRVYPTSEQEFLGENMEEKWKLPLFFPSEVTLTPHIRQLQEEGVLSILPQVEKEKIDSVTNGELCIRMGTQNSRYVGFCHLMTHPVPYGEIVATDVRRDITWGLPSCFGSSKVCRWEDVYLTLYAKLFRLLAEEKNAQVATINYYKELNSGYAKSFMLKKNIPQKVLNAMETSGFNTYFGFVEYDEETDIKRVCEIEKEFRALWETYLKKIDSTKNIIRFRKLGQHKAIGLYYPAYGCLCVDLRYTNSLVHEYGHLIDFTQGSLSNKSDFYPIRTAYKKSLEDAVSGNSELKGSLKGKYNLAYFLTPTEIFARCFELYVAKILGVKNSLVPEAFKEGIYPQHEEFLQAVKAYFDKLLSSGNAPDGVSDVKKVANITK